MSKNRLVFILGVLLIFSLFYGAFTSTAQAQDTIVNTSFSNISITPNPAARGQQVTVIGTISPDPPSGYAYLIRFYVIDPNGNYRNISANKTLTGTGTFYFTWTPDIAGQYLYIFDYPGETYAGIVHIPCNSNSSFLVDISLPTVTPTPTPLPTPEPTPSPSSTPTSNGTSTIPKNAPTLYVNCQSSTTYSNFKVNIQGTLTANNSGLSDLPIQLSYSIDGGNSWIPLTYLSTDDTGAFQAVWTPLVTGNYFLNATYAGNSELSPTSTIVHFAVLPFEDTSVFSVASNSTVTALTFNSTSQILSFRVSGENGTTGYVNVYISKSLISDTSKLAVYFDQELMQPVAQSVGDSWLVSFTYHHSVHTVTFVLNSDSLNIQMPTQTLQYIIAGTAGALLAIVVVLVLLRKTKRRVSE